MCKKTKVIVLLLFFVAFSGYAQRKLKGQKDLFVGIGITKLGQYGQLGGTLNIGEKTAISAELMYEIGEVRNFSFKTYNASAYFLYNAFNIKRVLYFSPRLGLTANLSNIEKIAEGNNDEAFDYGLVGGILVEGFVTNRLVLFCNADQRWFISNKFGSLAWYIGAGIKFIF